MANADIKLQIKEGTTTAPPSGNPGSGGSPWAQGKEKAADGKWTVLSAYWYSYSGTNKAQQPGKPAPTGGEVDLPDGGTFTVGPKSNELINNVKVTDEAATDHYTVTQPVPPAKTWNIADVKHTDPAGKTDYFDVYGQDKTGDPIVKCDPIIRNHGGN